jgi:hypothetical protein
MRGVRYALFTGTLLVFFCCSTLATRPGQATVPLPHRTSQPTAHPKPHPTRPPLPVALDQASLYSRRARRLVQSYLRLRVWQLRELDLDRARAVIDRKLGIESLLGETPAPNAR